MIKLSKQILLQNRSSIRRLEIKPICANSINRKYSSGSYEGDGKTNVKVLNNDLEMGLMVNSFGPVKNISKQINSKYSANLVKLNSIH